MPSKIYDVSASEDENETAVNCAFIASRLA
jgi:hypothetical protein